MKSIIYILGIFSILFLYSCEKCDDFEVEKCGEDLSNSPNCGNAVLTCFGDPGSDERVGNIYQTRDVSLAPNGEDWGTSINVISPSNWVASSIGQIFGIAIDNDDVIYLGASDIYGVNGNLNSPFPSGQIFKCEENSSWLATPMVELPNSGGILNGIGNLAYDKWNNQLFASNIEDGKIYRIDVTSNLILESYDPGLSDDGVPGHAGAESVWGLGINNENGVVKLYFPMVNGSNRRLYSIVLNSGSFPSSGSEVIEISNLPGNSEIVSDLSFSTDGKYLLISEKNGTSDDGVYSFELLNNQWVNRLTEYHIGTDNQMMNSSGGVDFGYDKNAMDKCIDFFWATGVNQTAIGNAGILNGIQGISFSGNLSSSMGSSGNSYSDLYVDLDGLYIDPCNIQSSLISNAGFEELSNIGIEPTTYGQLNLANLWEQATNATSDFFNVNTFIGLPFFDNLPPPNGSDHFAGAIVQGLDYTEYIGACLNSPTQPGVEYSMSFLLGNSGPGDFSGPAVMEGSFEVLGLPNCNFPISGAGCQSLNYEVIGNIEVNIPESQWTQYNLTLNHPTNSYPAIMFSLECTGLIEDHWLIDDIIITEGEPCDSSIVIKNIPGDVEVFDCTECGTPCTLNDFIK